MGINVVLFLVVQLFSLRILGSTEKILGSSDKQWLTFKHATVTCSSHG